MKKVITLVFAISVVACNINYEKTRSGLVYKIYQGKGGEKPKAGEFAKLNIRYILADRDSVLQSTYGKLPLYSPVDTTKQASYTFMEVLPLMSAGDSAEISISIDSLKSRGLIGDYDPLLVREIGR